MKRITNRSKLNNKSGVYMMRSKKDTDIYYIGATLDLYIRQYSHSKLHPLLQAHITNFGSEDLEYIILEYCDIDHLFEREQYYISELKPSLNANRIATNIGDKRSDMAKHKFEQDVKDDSEAGNLVYSESNIRRYLNYCDTL
jgi:group I intron endonuclease